jgi:phosphate starvation-inducible PhoH-like protein
MNELITPSDLKKKIFQKQKLKKPIKIRNVQLTTKQQELFNILINKDTKIIFIEGPAGSSKTWISLYAGLTLLNEKKISDIIYVRSLIESASKSIGFLPGDLGIKFEPFLEPLNDKLEEFLSNGDIKLLKAEDRIKPIPVNFLRGANFNAKYILMDESQNMNYKEIVTGLTRLGEFSKLVIAGDFFQSDLNGKSGFKKTFDLFNTEEARMRGIHTFRFDKIDIIRSELIGYILDVLESAKN